MRITTTAGWKKILPPFSFDHSKTKYPLLGKHVTVSCSACHINGDFKKGPDGIFTVTTATGSYRARSVILAIGKGGSPRKLSAKGEELPKVMYRLIEADHYVHKRILVVGGDSAVEAAMGLAHQVGNTVTLSYRQGAFTRIKTRNAQRLEAFIRKGKLKVIFNSKVLEITPDTAVLDVNGSSQRIPNDYVWIFAGDEPPTAFLKKIGIGFGLQDLTSTGSKEAKEAIQEKVLVS